jgi:hypothetical protein
LFLDRIPLQVVVLTLLMQESAWYRAQKLRAKSSTTVPVILQAILNVPKPGASGTQPQLAGAGQSTRNSRARSCTKSRALHPTPANGLPIQAWKWVTVLIARAMRRASAFRNHLVAAMTILTTSLTMANLAPITRTRARSGACAQSLGATWNTRKPRVP